MSGKYTGILFAVLLAVFTRIFILSVYKVPTHSMAPEILAGDYVLASKMAYGLRLAFVDKSYFYSEPKVGELVVYTKNAKTFIKRVVAKRSDDFDYSNGELSVNSNKCSYDLKRELAMGEMAEFEEVCADYKRIIFRPLNLAKSSQNIAKQKLDESSLLVAGDNRSFENNPNAIETVRYDQIVGKPIFVWMSYSSTQDFISETLGVRWNRILTNLN